MKMLEELLSILKKLRLSGVLDSLELRCQQATEDGLTHQEFLFRLLNDEVERREAKQLERRLKRANFEPGKTLESFDFRFNTDIPKSKVMELGLCQFVRARENLLLVGPTGTGKSHVAHALGQRACRAGFDVLCVSAERMLAQLRASRADKTYERKVQKFVTPDVLIIDDLGLRPLKDGEPLYLYDVIRMRYEKGSIVVTSNRAVEELYPLFGDELLASAAMDRLLHHSHLVTMQGESYRSPPWRKTLHDHFGRPQNVTHEHQGTTP